MNFDISKMMEQAKKLQENMKTSQADLEKITVEADSGGGMVKVKMNGALKVLNIEIEEEILKSDKDMIENLITAAINTAIEKAKKGAEELMGKKTSDILGNLNLNDLGKDIK